MGIYNFQDVTHALVAQSVSEQISIMAHSNIYTYISAIMNHISTEINCMYMSSMMNSQRFMQQFNEFSR